LRGAREIGFTVLSMSISLVAVFIPILLMGGVVGRLFREFAVTLSATILISAAVSLSLTPMMAAKILRHRPESEQGRFYRASERVFQKVIDFYDRTLVWVLARQRLTLAVAVGTLVATVLLFLIIPKGFFPIQDTGVILGISEATQDVSFRAMSERQQALARVILADPAVASLSSFIGVDGTNTTVNTGRFQINLKPLEDRDAGASEVIRRLAPKVEKVTGITLYMQPVQDLTVEDRVSRAQFQYSLEDADPNELATWVPRFVDRLRKLPELADVGSDQLNDGLQAHLVFDRTTASRLGITPQMLDDTLYDAFGQRQISTMFTQLNQYRVVLETKPGFHQTPQDLSSIFLRSADGGSVPLSAFTRVEERSTPLAVNHQGQFPVVTVSFNLGAGYSLGQALAAMEEVIVKQKMPASVIADFQGTAAAYQASQSNEGILILAALMTVYIVLGVLYESFIHPLTILSTLPSAGVGALLALRLFGLDLDIVGIIGIILLIGIVQKNGIMMVDFALELERNERKDAAQAIYQAALLRLRPILMTTMAALLSGIPLAFGNGIGSELRRPLGVAMVGGLLFSQVLTLYTTPVIYIFFDKLAARFSPRRRAADAGEPQGGIA
jgi:multidrug efflux pump